MLRNLPVFATSPRETRPGACRLLGTLPVFATSPDRETRRAWGSRTCSLRQLLEAGYFHADPHPGNLLATRDGKLAFLDFGMMSETPGPARLAIIEHVVHLVNRDYQAMAQDYYALGFLERSVDVSPCQ